MEWGDVVITLMAMYYAFLQPYPNVAYSSVAFLTMQKDLLGDNIHDKDNNKAFKKSYSALVELMGTME